MKIVSNSLKFIQYIISCPFRFLKMLRYAWFASKLTDEREVFMNVNEVYFSHDVLKQSYNCKNVVFVRYARCRVNDCFACFYDKYNI